jgi:hypothetical protein
MSNYPQGIFQTLTWLVKKVKILLFLVTNLRNYNTIDNPPYVEISWDDIANGWATLANANNNIDGNFQSMVTIGNSQRLYGGSNINISSGYLATNTHIISINDPSGMITAVTNSQFQDCTNLQYINLAKAEIIGTQTFKNCADLCYVNLPATSYLGDQGFNNCSNLQILNINTCQTLDYGANGVFVNVSGATITVTLPIALETNDNILDLQGNNTVTLILL